MSEDQTPEPKTSLTLEQRMRAMAAIGDVVQLRSDDVRAVVGANRSLRLRLELARAQLDEIDPLLERAAGSQRSAIWMALMGFGFFCLSVGGWVVIMLEVLA